MKRLSMKTTIMLLGFFLSMGIFSSLTAHNAFATGEIMTDFTKLPPFLTADVKPNIIIAYDISGSMKLPAYNDTSVSWSGTSPHHDFDPDYEYYGYFDICSNQLLCDTEANHDAKYTYDTTNGFFYRADAAGDWSGNYLNWLTMRRADVARKVMIGGKVRDRAGETLTVNGTSGTWFVVEGQNEPEDRTFRKTYVSSNTKNLTPAIYPDDTEFLISNGQILPQVAGASATQTNIQSVDGKSVEMGMVSMRWDNGDPWLQVTFLNNYAAAPVVVAKPVTYNGGDPVTARVRNVTTTGFEIRLQEFEYKDGNHTSEDIMYIVADKGHYDVPTGGTPFTVDAKEITSFNDCGTVNFSNESYAASFAAGVVPALFTGVSSFASDDVTNSKGYAEKAAVITRNESVSSAGYKVVMQEQKSSGSNTCTHGNETIHAIAITKGSGVTTSENAQLEVAATGTTIDENWNTINYTTAFAAAPMVVMDMQTTNGSDSCTLRIQSQTASSVQVKVHEDVSDGSDQDHQLLEQVAYVAVTAGGNMNIKIGVQAEPTGLIQGLSTKVRFGLAVYNYDHDNISPTNIYNGNTVDGGTLKPCYPDISKPVDQRTNYDICRETHVKSPVANLIDVIEDHPLIWGTTPIAETLYTIYGYVSQTDNNTSGLDDQYYPNGTDLTVPHCYGVGGSAAADNKYTSATCTAAGGKWDYSYSYEVRNSTAGTEVWDPYWYDDANNGAGGLVDCAMTFILNFNDGEPYRDWENGDGAQPSVPGDGDGNTGDREFLDDMALYLRDHDLRTDADLPGYQEIISYYVLAALGEDVNTLQPRKVEEAAASGGFEDSDDDHKPDPVHPTNFPAYTLAGSCTPNEWDDDGDCFPDTFYFANDGYSLVVELTQAFSDMLKRLSSGTAASVISNSRSGEGAVYQAVFYPNQQDSALRSISWAGDVHSLWLDDQGNIREDCGATSVCGAGNECSSSCAKDYILDTKVDRILEFYTDSTSGAARARRYADIDGNGIFTAGKLCSDSNLTNETDCLGASETWDYGNNPDFLEENVMLRDVRYIWSAGQWLADASPDQKANYSDITAKRYMFTQFDGSGSPSMVNFTDSASGTGVAAALTPQEYKAYLYAGSAAEADKIINYVRGTDQAGYRSRQIDWDDNGTVETYKLGDIVHSTPTVVSTPAEDYDTIYNDESYRQFRKAYKYRRTMVYAGGNDGALHAFNAGYYDRNAKEFLKAPPTDPVPPVPPALQTYASQYDLGSEMWAYVPKNVLPHLRWLTDPSYSHVYYVDLKPYIFDAKIFEPDAKHPHGWGTVLVGGMRFGGGDIGIDTDGDGTDDETMRSSYYVLDITDPECPPVVLAEFNDADLGFTLSEPTAVPMLRCDRYISGSCPDNSDAANTWPMDWYLAFGSGPHVAGSPQEGMLGRSDHDAKMYVLKLGGTAGTALPYASSGTASGCVPTTIFSLAPLVDTVGGTYSYPSTIVGSCSDVSKITAAACTGAGGTWDAFHESFVTGVIAVDYDLSFQAESLYFGSISDSNDADHDNHHGGMHRLVLDNDYGSPVNWYMDTFYDADQPVTATPSVATDGQRAWVYFGTGRFYTAGKDKASTSQQTYYGIKEAYDSNNDMSLDVGNGRNLIDVSSVWVENLTGTLSEGLLSTGGDILSSTTFNQLKNEVSEQVGSIDKYHGWKIDFDMSGERNVGQPAILGDIVTFTTYVPSTDFCNPEGESYLWAPYYRTGTAYRKSVIGLVTNGATDEVLRKTSLGKGLATTPNIHAGGEDGTKAFVQTSTGAIIGIEQSNPGVVKSGITSWRELSN